MNDKVKQIFKENWTKKTIEVSIFRDMYQEGKINKEQLDSILIMFNESYYKGLKGYFKAKKEKSKIN